MKIIVKACLCFLFVCLVGWLVGWFLFFGRFLDAVHSEVREVKEIQAWTEKGEAIAPPTSYLREREGGGKRERESAVVVL